jgi:hypothetical protein
MLPFSQLQIARKRTHAKFPYLIEITHPDYGVFRYANADEMVMCDGNNYQPATFSIQPPERNGGKIGNASLSISAVDQFWIEKIRGTQKPADIRFIAVIVYDKDNGEVVVEPLEENRFTLRKASWNETAITWEMIFDDTQSYILNSELCDSATAPGIA